MKKALFLALALSAGSSLAAPFVLPAAWMAENPSQAKAGGEVRTYSLSDYKTLNPFTSSEADSLPTLMASVGLFTQDPSTDKFIPYMADAMPVVSNNNKRFVIKIRQGMKFSDGQAITADDFITTFKIHTDDKVGSNSYDSYFINGKPITLKKLDNYTLQFDFPQASASAYSRMGGLTPWPDHVFGPVYKSKGAEGIKAMWSVSANPSTIVSPGPWVISSYQAGQRAVLKKNTYFGEWAKDGAGKPLPYLDTMSIRLLKDLNAGLAAYLAGQTDTFAASKADDLAQIKRAIDGGNLKANLVPNVSPNATSSWIVFNWNKSGDVAKQKIFRDVRFRQAMSHIANRQAMIQLALGGLGSEVYTGVYPVFKNYQFDSTPKYKYDLAAATKLLAQMGFSKKNAQGYLTNSAGQVLEFNMATNAGNTVREQLGRIFTDEAKKVGVKVNFTPIDFNNLVDQLNSKGANRPFDAILLGLSGGDNIWPYGSNVVPCGGNLHSFNVPSDGKCLTPQESLMTKLYFQGDQTLDDDARRKIGEQLSKAEAQNQGFIYLVGTNYHVTYSSRLGGEYKRNLWDAYNQARPYAHLTTYIK
ncbi:ABC transporter substrate-binding protein [Deinococcus sp. Leaf326]|jgi:peptide/nickel transport system substrate-binding protein|uniref:ABC transporter substrate-binding protein n=1 Tax=Deinococcus sp. Leaf326 TaxID=1736338 RepID=UPI000700D4B5|nr:ABC transporter substrate-binding protein [Deinococcus sp. Leaf326]KQR40645.1 peptide-binding protein [Deinococcus sp. Leaf326]